MEKNYLDVACICNHLPQGEKHLCEKKDVSYGKTVYVKWSPEQDTNETGFTEFVPDKSIPWENNKEEWEEEFDEMIAKERESKDEAYRERNMLVCALTKLFPAYLARHNEDDATWERDWMWIVYIDLPTGQVSWHIHDSEREIFNHLEVKQNNWDGHNTERKYERLQALSDLKERISKEI